MSTVVVPTAVWQELTVQWLLFGLPVYRPGDSLEYVWADNLAKSTVSLQSERDVSAPAVTELCLARAA
jgi:hypothetical protein